MNVRRSTFGDTWRVLYGSRSGIQVARRGGGGVDPVVPRTRVWATDVGRADLGDKWDDATSAAWSGSHWTWGKPVSSVKDAAVAARWLFLEASKEAGTSAKFNPAWYHKKAQRAAYHYDRDGLTPRYVLATVYSTLFGVPRAREKAMRLINGISAATPPTSVRSRPAEKSVRYAPPSEQAPSAAEGWLDRLPPWSPWAAGGAALLALVLLLRPPSLPRQEVIRVVGP